MKPFGVFTLNSFDLLLIPQSAARDADKVFLAAIDKFDAMMSKSNVYASDGMINQPQPCLLANSKGLMCSIETLVDIELALY